MPEGGLRRMGEGGRVSITCEVCGRAQYPSEPHNHAPLVRELTDALERERAKRVALQAQLDRRNAAPLLETMERIAVEADKMNAAHVVHSGKDANDAMLWVSVLVRGAQAPELLRLVTEWEEENGG